MRGNSTGCGLVLVKNFKGAYSTRASEVGVLGIMKLIESIPGIDVTNMYVCMYDRDFRHFSAIKWVFFLKTSALINVHNT
jgi:hypothetical protein